MDGERGQLRYASLMTLLIACALLLATRLIYLFLADPYRFPINTIKIEASYHHITHQQLETILNNYQDSSFFSLPVSHLHSDLSALEWIKKAQIERIWPDTLKIILEEKIPIAIWNDEMLSIDGKTFHASGTTNDSSLPHLKGPENQQQEVLQVYEKMSKILSIYGLYASLLEWRDNHAWELTLSNDVLLHLGKRHLETRITRFCKAYPAVFAEKQQQLVSIDLRYPRGMAVQWKKEP